MAVLRYGPWDGREVEPPPEAIDDHDAYSQRVADGADQVALMLLAPGGVYEYNAAHPDEMLFREYTEEEQAERELDAEANRIADAIEHAPGPSLFGQLSMN